MLLFSKLKHEVLLVPHLELYKFQVRHNKAISRDTWAQLLEFVKVLHYFLSILPPLQVELQL
jgi:hypothetical protein